jgi:hypothetical protein
VTNDSGGRIYHPTPTFEIIGENRRMARLSMSPSNTRRGGKVEAGGLSFSRGTGAQEYSRIDLTNA